MNAGLLECEEKRKQVAFRDNYWERVLERNDWIGSCDDPPENESLGGLDIDSDPWEERESRGIERPKPAKDEVDELYDTLALLNAEREKCPEDVTLQQQIQRLFARLRAVQTQEAAAFRRQFEQSLTMAMGSGIQALSEVRSLLKKYEDPAPRDSASKAANDSQT